MSSWGSYLFFPPVVEKAGAGREWKTDTVQTDATEIFQARWSEGRWRFTISGKIHARDIEIWDAFVDALQGGFGGFLFGLKSKRFQLSDQTHPTGAALIGTGDGVRTRFQLVKTRAYPYGPKARIAPEKVRFPWHDYPPLFYPNGTRALDTDFVRVWVDGVEQAPGSFSILREGGAITLSTAPGKGAEIRASCRYFVLVHGQDFMPVEAEKSAQVYTFSQGAELIEAKGEIADLFDELDAQVGASWL